MAKRGISAFIGGIALGSAVGAVVGLLVAPRSGRETRQTLRKSAQALPEMAEDVSSSVQWQATRFSESTLHRWDGTLNRLKGAIAAGIEASRIETATVEEQPDASSDQKSSTE